MRTRRWASTAISDDEMWNGCTPISTRRVTAPAASLVWRVLKHQVTGERRVDRDLGRLVVANLADHDDVGILAQEGAQPHAKVRPIFGLHLHLVDALELVLDRILGGEDVDARACSSG